MILHIDHVKGSLLIPVLVILSLQRRNVVDGFFEKAFEPLLLFLTEVQALQFDDQITAPLLGLKDAKAYYQKASAFFLLDKLTVPSLMVNPKNDPFLGGGSYPVEIAQNSDTLFLETPESGGHCGFITLGHEEWWPTKRAKEFLVPLAQ